MAWVGGPRNERERRLPSWAHGLPARAQNALIWRLEDGAISNLEPITVLNYGWSGWMRWANLGKVSVDPLIAAAKAALPREWERYQQAWRMTP